ncbi:MAG: hypothetical protein AB2L14_28890 [Candidatus Xenobiia bacterium LiM19]
MPVAAVNVVISQYLRVRNTIESTDLPAAACSDEQFTSINDQVNLDDSKNKGGFTGWVKSGVMKTVNFVDRWTSPKESIHGNLEKPSYFQSCFSAASMGYVFGGFQGSVASIAASTVGIFTISKTKSTAFFPMAHSWQLHLQD